MHNTQQNEQRNINFNIKHIKIFKMIDYNASFFRKIYNVLIVLIFVKYLKYDIFII